MDIPRGLLLGGGLLLLLMARTAPAARLANGPKHPWAYVAAAIVAFLLFGVRHRSKPPMRLGWLFALLVGAAAFFLLSRD